MTRFKKLNISICVLCLSFFTFCSAENNVYSSGEISSIISNIHDSIIAVFEKDKSLIILRKNNHQAYIGDAYRKEFPTHKDTLKRIKNDEFFSTTLNTTYLLKDTSVIEIQTVKIIHPSSNWQGQTPWQQPYVNTFRRIK